MELAAYQTLIDDVCVISLIPPSPDRYESANLRVEGVDFTLQPRVHEQRQQVAIYADLGPLSEGDNTQGLLSLLESNLHIFQADQSAVFAFNPDTRHVLLLSGLDVAVATASAVLLTMKAFAQLALEWRKNAFQESRSSSSPLMPVTRRADPVNDRDTPRGQQ